jgi:hypothetical protein
MLSVLTLNVIIPSVVVPMTGLAYHTFIRQITPLKMFIESAHELFSTPPVMKFEDFLNNENASNPGTVLYNLADCNLNFLVNKLECLSVIKSN